MPITKIEKLTPATYFARDEGVYMRTSDGYTSLIQSCKGFAKAAEAVKRWERKEAAGIARDYKERVARVTDADIADLRELAAAVGAFVVCDRCDAAIAGNTAARRDCEKRIRELRTVT